MIHQKFNDNRALAELTCVKNFLMATGAPDEFSKPEREVLKDIALWAESMEVKNPDSLQLMYALVRHKSVDLYQYQYILRKFFQGSKGN